MESINPQEPVAADLVRQMEAIKQIPAVPPIPTPMPQPTVETGLRYAGFWLRFIASFVDDLLLIIFVTLIMVVAFKDQWSGLVDFIVNTNPYLSPLAYVATAYNVIFIGWRGQTLGKQWLGIKVVNYNSTQVSWGQAIVREVFKIVSSNVFLLGYLWMLWDKDKQTWHDKVAKTYVIKIK